MRSYAIIKNFDIAKMAMKGKEDKIHLSLSFADLKKRYQMKTKPSRI